MHFYIDRIEIDCFDFDIAFSILYFMLNFLFILKLIDKQKALKVYHSSSIINH
jgi:hypothetical protein